MEIPELIMGKKIELDILEQLALDPSDAPNYLPVALVVERCEVETRPFRKETV